MRDDEDFVVLRATIGARMQAGQSADGIARELWKQGYRAGHLATTLDGVQRWSKEGHMCHDPNGKWVAFSDLANLQNAGQVGRKTAMNWYYAGWELGCDKGESVNAKIAFDEAWDELGPATTTKPQSVSQVVDCRKAFEETVNRNGSGLDLEHCKYAGEDEYVCTSTERAYEVWCDSWKYALRTTQPQPVHGVPTVDEFREAGYRLFRAIKANGELSVDQDIDDFAQAIHTMLLNRQEGR